MAGSSFFRQVHEHGWRSTFNFGPRPRPTPAAPGRGYVRRRSSRGDRRDVVEAAIRKLPMETYYTRSELSGMTVHELKAKAREMGVDCSTVVEKRDLINRMSEVGGSSGASCSICCEDYDSGDMMRALPCGHRFHVECVDKWFLTATNYSRGPSCPMCNAPLVPNC